MTVSLQDYKDLTRRDRGLLHRALNDHIDKINGEGGTITGQPPRRER